MQQAACKGGTARGILSLACRGATDEMEQFLLRFNGGERIGDHGRCQLRRIPPLQQHGDKGPLGLTAR